MKKRMLLLAILWIASGPAHSQQRSMPPWPDPREWGPEEQQRRIPPRYYDPYDRGPERFQPPPQPVSPEEYERRAFCAMHPQACRY